MRKSAVYTFELSIDISYRQTIVEIVTNELYSNTFPIPEIIFDPSLILSPHVLLLGLILADGAFAPPSLTSAQKLSELDIRPGSNQLPLL